MKFGFDWPSGFREDVCNYGHIHVNNLGTGADNPMESKYFHKHKSTVSVVFCYTFSPLNDIVTVLPFNRKGNQI